MFFNRCLVIPLVWCLTSKKTEEVYKRIFKVLKKKAEGYGCQLTPQHVYLGFELSAMNALEKIVSLNRNRKSAYADTVRSQIVFVYLYSFLF